MKRKDPIPGTGGLSIFERRALISHIASRRGQLTYPRVAAELGIDLDRARLELAEAEAELESYGVSFDAGTAEMMRWAEKE